MALSPEERAQRARFELLYKRSQTPVMLAIESSVCGCDYGGNSWTTRAEAEQIATSLALKPGMRLLDLGAGSGWPGLYLGKTSGCDVVLVDLPLSGLRIAAERADKESLSGTVWTAVADAADLPFQDGSFDAISHSDLLCCLRQKHAVLDACRRAVRDHGRMVFTVVCVAPGLSAKKYCRAVANGPEFIETDTEYPALLAQTGWNITGHEDITMAYSATCRRQLHADETQRDRLVPLFGASEFAKRVAGWRSKIAAMRDNLLRRELFVAEPRSDWAPATRVTAGGDSLLLRTEQKDQGDDR
jgi:cyclopropane fatty-acyl-phospholipid synthase-like methyltransferase